MDEGFYFEEYQEGWSHETRAKKIRDEDILKFVDLHAFYTPTFMNMKYAEAMPEYGGRMAPGLFVLCLAEGLALDAGLTRRRGIFLMELTPKFLKPVFAGESIVNRIRLKSKRVTSKPDRGIVVTSHEVITDTGVVAITYDSTRMIRTRQFVEAPEASR
jgi:acyl dehydratase